MCIRDSSQAGWMVLLGIGTLQQGAQPNFQTDWANALLDRRAVVAATATLSIWVFVASLSWVVPEKVVFQQSAGFVFTTTLFRELLTFPVFAIFALQARAGLHDQSPILPGVASEFFMVFVAIISQLGQESLRGCIAACHRLDVRYPLSFQVTTQTMSLLATGCVIFVDSQSTHRVVMIAATGLNCWLPVWYRCVKRTKFCSSVWGSVLYSTVSAVALLTCIGESVSVCSDLLSHHRLRWWLVMLGTVVLTGLIFAWTKSFWLRRRWKMEALQAHMPELLDRLNALTGRVTATQASMGASSSPEIDMFKQSTNAQQLAVQLECFEEQVLAERMHDEFLQARPKWLMRLEDAQVGGEMSFHGLYPLVEELYGAICVPNTATELVRVLKCWQPLGKGVRLPIDICMLILRQVMECDMVDWLLAPLLVILAGGRAEDSRSATCDVHRFIENLRRLGLMETAARGPHKESNSGMARPRSLSCLLSLGGRTASVDACPAEDNAPADVVHAHKEAIAQQAAQAASVHLSESCLLYTSPSPRDS
eukprot:TRINITY_DN13480_c0_g2_i2.p1 TRINITY_DN13480_c0_g2~~TRINITY_DN13480_c0_g2_i2.p1  ORF type:complete len:537 (-),score=79.74 TRINITY_DN13480_c0_g2_i2:138-1748(-)